MIVLRKKLVMQEREENRFLKSLNRKKNIFTLDWNFVHRATGRMDGRMVPGIHAILVYCTVVSNCRDKNH